MKKPLEILVADDDSSHRAMLATLLRDWGYGVIEAADGGEAVKICRKASPMPDLALLDVRMPGKTGLEAMAEIRTIEGAPPVVIMTAYSDIPAAVEAIRNGAYDYLTKPLDFNKLEITLRNVFAQLGLMRENASLAASLAEKRDEKDILIGASAPMAALADMIRTVAPTEATILISGESGTGKELAARSIHRHSARAAGPFVPLNCGALTESILASELFGHEKGAFTGADKKHEGLFMAAEGGSIFLDEIGEMPQSMQVKLLRALQEREILSVGGKKPRPINCRVLAATNRDLAEEIRRGRFREDLYYRLNVVSLRMPPLRERADDIPLLAEKFAKKFAAINHRRFSGIDREAMDLLMAWKWPGNVRELENVIERGVILMPGERMGVRDLPERFTQAGIAEKSRQNNLRRENWSAPANGGSSAQSGAPSCLVMPEGFPSLEEVERAVILQTLKKFGDNKTETARALGITRKTLHAKLNRYRGGEPADN